MVTNCQINDVISDQLYRIVPCNMVSSMKIYIKGKLQYLASEKPFEGACNKCRDKHESPECTVRNVSQVPQDMKGRKYPSRSSV